jgi:hypothetical protein
MPRKCLKKENLGVQPNSSKFRDFFFPESWSLEKGKLRRW